jgi:hypothetical protein
MINGGQQYLPHSGKTSQGAVCHGYLLSVFLLSYYQYLAEIKPIFLEFWDDMLGVDQLCYLTICI